MPPHPCKRCEPRVVGQRALLSPAEWMPPVCAKREPPPLRPVAQINLMCRRREHQRPWLQHVWQRAGIVLRIRRDFCHRHITCRREKPLELPVGDRRARSGSLTSAVRAMDRRIIGRCSRCVDSFYQPALIFDYAAPEGDRAAPAPAQAGAERLARHSLKPSDGTRP